MKSNKNSWISLLTLLLLFLQPVLSFGHVSAISPEIVNNQEKLTFFKAKGAKALVYQEITIASVDVVVSAASKTKCSYINKLESFQNQVVSEISNYLIDFRSVLAAQIFPFHFFL